jgi:hypothetical protein
MDMRQDPRPKFMSEAASNLVLRGEGRPDRRKSPRKSAINVSLVTVEIEPGGFGLMLDVSEGGTSLQVMSRLKPGSAAEIGFKLPGMETSVEGSALVSWCDAEGRAGLQFQQLKGEGSKELRQWIESLPISIIDEPSLPTPDADDVKVQLRSI